MSDLLIRLLAIAAGGGAGAVARYGISVACNEAWGGKFAHGTLIANVLGCFALGVLMHEAWLVVDKQPSVWHTGATVGLLGGLTTFSTFGFQTVRHFEAGEPLLALANVALNLVLGLAAAALGLLAARALWPVG